MIIMTSRKKTVSNENMATTKITDFYTSPIKVKIIKEDGVLKVKEDFNSSLQSSSVLLTPESSPIKDKECTNKNTNNNNNYEQLSLKLTQVCSQDPILCGLCQPVCLPSSQTIKSENLDPEFLPENKSSHCKQILDNDVEIVSYIPSLTPVAHLKVQTQTSQQLKRRGRKGRVKSAASATPPVIKTEEQAKPKTSRKKKVERDASNKTITDFFPVRRSGRKCKSQLMKDRMLDYEEKVLSYCEDGLEVVDLEGKGRGVIATKAFKKGDFVVEYSGDLIDIAESKDRETFYGMSTKFGCYMYYFVLQGKHYCIDATLESGKLGRLLNHSRSGNCCTKVIDIKNRPFLILIAKHDIIKGEELLYDYGDRSKESLEAHPWLKF